MNISLKWLSEYLDGEPLSISKKDIKEYCDRMTYSGSKVENFEILFAELENIVVGRLVSIEKHPGADKLFVCMVEIGEGEPVQIVTGATNLKAGDIIPVAKNNSTIHGGKRITKGKLRGVESNGMLCSLEELGLDLHDFPDADPEGILVLGEGEGHKIGQDIKEALLLADAAVEFEITPNRADCFSYIGLARESAVTLNRELKLHEPKIKREDKTDDIKNYLSVEVKNYDLCPRYTAKVIKEAKIGPSPLWMRARLRASGIRPINNIVDITNYVMLEYGQPMHAFDYSFIEGKKIEVRCARPGEQITTLDGTERKLEENMLTISDMARPVALAGIMGGENSGILDDTKTIVFESANFEKMCVRHTSRKLGLRTDSSANFEKGLDLHLTIQAINRACELVEELSCGTVVSGQIDEYESIPENKRIKLNADKVNALLGSSIGEEEMLNILQRLDFGFVGRDALGAPEIEVPSGRRGDILGENKTADTADLAEEISRIYGYGNIKNNANPPKRGGRNDFQKFLQRIHSALISGGYYETYTFSFVSPKHFDMLNLPEDSPLCKHISLINPLGEETSAMKTTLLSSTLSTLAKNRRSDSGSGYFYELAKTYFAPEHEVSGDVKGKFAANEKNVLSLGFFDPDADFYSLSGTIENLMEAAGIKDYRLNSDTSSHALSCAFHPGRSALVQSSVGDINYGIFGEVHPDVAESFEIGARCHAAEIDIDLLYKNSGAQKTYAPVPKYPAVTRDLALVCDENVESAVIYDIIKEQSGKIFEWARPFDVYKSEKLGEGKKSIAFSISFRDQSRTLADEEVNVKIDKILKNLEAKNITLRA